MKHNGNHRQNNEKPMKTNGSTHDQKMTKYAKRMQYPYPPIQGHLVYSHLIMYIYYVIYTAHMYMCV